MIKTATYKAMPRSVKPTVWLSIFFALILGCSSDDRVIDIIPVGDTTPPVIVLVGENPQDIEFGNNYVELGANASDDIDGDISANIIIDASSIDTTVLGSYSVTYNVSDVAGNIASTETRTVNVVDTIAPLISLIGASPQTLEVNATYSELGATAQDNFDGDISANITIDASALDITTEGSYSISYDVSDSSGNAAITINRVINVVSVRRTFISANNGIDGVELFITDGTSEGTVMLKDINPNGDSWPREFVEVNGILYFSADNGTANGRELWSSDGTSDGTQMVKDINQGELSSDPKSLTELNGIVFFSASDGTITGRELWKSNGTDVGTVLVSDMAPDRFDNSEPRFLTAVGELLFFTAKNSAVGRELWKSDGTDVGTELVKNINLDSLDSNPSHLLNINGVLYFSAYDRVAGTELWKSDGTEAGTIMVKDIRTGGPSFHGFPTYLTNLNGMLVFSATGDSNGRELWKSDGTEEGTLLIKDIKISGDSRPSNLTVVDGTLFFQADASNLESNELWKSDGTVIGTQKVKEINPNGGSGAFGLVDVGGKLFFQANDGTAGRELWISDGTDAGTFMLKDINESGNSEANPQTSFNNYKPIILPDGRLLFGANDSIQGLEPWVTDGTTTGTTLLKDINPGLSTGFYRISN